MPVSELSETEIMARLAEINSQSSTLYREKATLDAELARRANTERGEVFEEMLFNEHFGQSFDVHVSFRLRVPDSDWIEESPGAQDLVGKTYLFNEGTMTFRGHDFRVSHPDHSIHVFPNTSTRDGAAWKALLSAVGPRLDRFSVKWALDSVEVLATLLRALPPEKDS